MISDHHPVQGGGGFTTTTTTKQFSDTHWVLSSDTIYQRLHQISDSPG